MANTLPNSNAFNDFGGTKVDYSNVTNTQTDWSADNVNSAFAATASMTRTAIRGFVRFTTAATTGAMVLNTYESVWKGDTATVPTLARSSTGVFTVTFPTSVSDPLGNTISVNLRSCTTSISGNGTFGFANHSITAANVVTVYTANTAGSANDLVGTVITIWVV